MSGASVARSLAWALDIPAVEVHHMEGHLLAPLLEADAPGFPFVALLVSGGHTLLAYVENIGRYEIIGQSLDDAAGEAFDKTAKMMGLGYPGGPVLAKLAESGSKDIFVFPRPMTDRPGLDFSFSGLKTFALNTWMQHQHDSDDLDQLRADIARAFEEAVVDTLLIKCRRALDQSRSNRLVVAGGVGANQRLRQRLHQAAKKHRFDVSFPRLEFCTDNGAMIAYAGCLRLQAGQSQPRDIDARARWPMDALLPVSDRELDDCVFSFGPILGSLPARMFRTLLRWRQYRSKVIKTRVAVNSADQLIRHRMNGAHRADISADSDDIFEISAVSSQTNKAAIPVIQLKPSNTP